MAAHPRVTVVYADDNAQYRTRLLHAMLEDDAIDVVAVAVDGGAALQAIRRLRPDVAVVDAETTGLSGLDIAEAIAADADAPGTRVLLLADVPLPSPARATAAVGPDGVIDRATARDDVVAAVRAAAGTPARA